MKHDQETYELIERYLKGDLEGEELQRFEQAIEQSAELREEVTLQRSVDTLLADEAIDKLDNQLTALRSEYIKNPNRSIQRTVWFSVAAVLILIATFVVIFRNNGEVNTEELYASYFELYPTDNSVRTEDAPQSGALELGLKAYEVKEFEKASDILKSLIVEDTRALFYYNLSQMALDKTEEAAILLQAIDDSSIYSDPADWYSALALLKQGKLAMAITLLKQLQETASGKYQKLASELLEELQ